MKQETGFLKAEHSIALKEGDTQVTSPMIVGTNRSLPAKTQPWVSKYD